MLSALLLTTLFTGCHDPFDDTEIVNRLDKLEERVTKLEKGFQAQAEALKAIATLQQAVEALQDATTANAEEIAKLTGVTVVEIQNAIKDLQEGTATLGETLSKLGLTIIDCQFNEATGKYEVTLSNGTTIELLANDNAIDAVKVMTADDGKMYWAVKGEFILDANGNKIPVSVTPTVKIDPATTEVMVSLDGGNSWHNTGLIIGEEVPALFSAVEYDDDKVYFTLADGTVLVVDRGSLEVAADMVVKLPVMKLYVPYGETQQVKIQMTNVAKYIIVKPEGWRVSLENGLLNVTAPAEGVGEEVGYVQLFTVDSEGKSAISDLKVQAGTAPITVTIEDGIATIAVDEDYAADENWPGFIYGIGDIGVYATSLEDVYNSINPYFAIPSKETVTIDIEESYGPLEDGIEYVVYAVDRYMGVDEYGYEDALLEPFEDMYYASYMNPYIDIQVLDQTFKDAKVKVAAYGMDKAYTFITYFDTPATDEDLEVAAANAKMEALDMWGYYAQYGDYDLPNSLYEGPLSELNDLLNYTSTLYPGRTYMIMAVPADNVTSDAIVYEYVHMKSFEIGQNSASVTLSDIVEGLTEVSATITPGSGTEYRYMFMDAETYAACPTDEDKLSKMLSRTSYKNQRTVSYDANPGEETYLVVLAYDVNTGVGNITTQKLVAKAMVFSTETVSYEVVSTKINGAEIKVTASEGVTALKIYTESKSYFDYGYASFTLAEVDQAMALRNFYDQIDVTTLAEDGKYAIENLEPFAETYIFVMGYDAAGNPTKTYYEAVSTDGAFRAGWTPDPTTTPIIKDVFFVDDYVADDPNADWKRMSELTDPSELNELYGAFKLDVDWNGIEVKNVWISNGDPGLAGVASQDTKTIISIRSSFTPDIMYQTSDYGPLRLWNDTYTEKIPTTLYVAYEDVNGNFYPYIEVVPESFIPVDNGGSAFENWQEGGDLSGWE